jgi:hypothetical protein
MQRRPLDIADVSDELLRELGLVRGYQTAECYRCSDPETEVVPLHKTLGSPSRWLNRTDVASILIGIRDGAAISPVVAFREPGAEVATLLHGMHRCRASLAVGFRAVPAILVSREEATDVYGYPDAQRGSKPFLGP